MGVFKKPFKPTDLLILRTFVHEFFTLENSQKFIGVRYFCFLKKYRLKEKYYTAVLFELKICILL